MYTKPFPNKKKHYDVNWGVKYTKRCMSEYVNQ